MIYGLLANFMILLHLAWIMFLIFGFVFALIKSRIAFLHVAGLLFTFILNLMGWYCPLTYLENYLRLLHDSRATYTGSFIYNYLDCIIYPDLPEPYIRICAIIFAVLNMVGYAYLAKRSHILDRLRGC